MTSSAQRIDHRYERKPAEVRVAGVDFPDSVLAHEDGGMSIVKNVSAQMRRFRNYFVQDIRVS